MTWQRARTVKQKEVRIREIIAAVERLYETHDYEQITLAAIAKEARFTRSNLYKYFTTKEEIFLELIITDIFDWIDDLESTYRDTHSLPVHAFASLWADSFIRHERLARLAPILFTSLEKHATIENLAAFKQELYQVLERSVTLLCRQFPALSPDTAGLFMHSQLAVAIGLYPMTHPTPKQLEASKQAGITHAPHDFRDQYARHVEYILNGILADMDSVYSTVP